ncbi:GNAT family N-acetyltransferase [Paenibacillus hunanensis]|uniref:GNAT family N-acetyltransferase n=1 Tax=Paenibacillus hunanensis TaxID=539262 RepID=UPI002A6A8A8C|nr:GNAT family N-acetyltransferase [Paenibacillus hunanensis]WPP40272.1 GNAT family N-acetyltransferase [Paenibacillus hunanensis]
MSIITIQQRTAQHADLRQLIAELDEDLLLRYPPELIHGMDLDHPDVENNTFMVAYVDDQPAGCGAIRKLDEQYTELKRFFVRGTYRRQGIAGRLLQALESAAVEQGFIGIRLETGSKQQEAMAFYERNGYVPIERFGEYIGEEQSRCYEKMPLQPIGDDVQHVGN